MVFTAKTLVIFVILFFAGYFLAKQLPSTFYDTIVPRIPNTRFQPTRSRLPAPKMPRSSESFLRMQDDVARAKELQHKFNFSGPHDPR